MNKQQEEIVRYENSEDGSEEEDEDIYINYDFIQDHNLDSLNNMQSENNVELSHVNNFIGMSHFDEASRAGFAMSQSTKRKIQPTGNHKTNNVDTNPGIQFNFNYESEIEKFNFETNNFDKDKIGNLLESGNIYSEDNYKHNQIFTKEDFIQPVIQKSYFEENIKHKPNEINKKSSVPNLIKKNEVNNHVPKIDNVSRSIDDYDRVNLKTLSDDDLVK